MRAREKARILRRFMRGEGVEFQSWNARIKGKFLSHEMIEAVLREGLAGRFDGKPKAGAR
jgi:hypothetical protein